MWPTQIALYLLGDHDLGWDMLVGFEGAVALLGLAGTGYMANRMRGAERDAGERSRLVATVSHEVRNPLTGVIGLSDTLLEQWNALESTEARDLVALISAEAHSMSAIVEDLLEFSRLSSGSLQVETREMDLAETVKERTPMCRAMHT